MKKKIKKRENRGNSKCKDPGVEVCLMSLMNTVKASYQGEEKI